MKPTFSIIFFTVISGAGLGLLSLLALADLCQVETLPKSALTSGIALALALIFVGLASSTLHLAKPSNAWRAFSRFRTSWLSREAVFAAALTLVAFVYGGSTADGVRDAIRLPIAALTSLLCWTVLFCTAMIYASLKPIRQWHTRWTPVNYVLLGHWSGALLLAAIASAYGMASRSLLILAVGLGVASLAAKLAYWYTIGKSAPTTLAHAIGVDQGVRGPGALSVAQARLLDVGHSRGTFLTDEFGFVLARQHATTLRAVALMLAFGLPLLWLVAGGPRWQPALAAAACGIIGLLVERWLFFAEARHTVRLYHGDPRT